MKYLLVSACAIFLALLAASCIPSVWAEREFYAAVKREVKSWDGCPNLNLARQKMQLVERTLVKSFQKNRAFFGLARLGRIGYEDILVQNENQNCLIGYVMEVDLRPLLVFPYTVHSVRKIEK
jgi:hypothetical protein